jgi:plastocyanin
MNKNTALLGVVLLVLASLAVLFVWQNNKFEPAPAQEVVTVSGDTVIKMGDDGYTPQNIQIKKGSKVQFVNEASSLRWPASDLHPSHLVYSAFDPKEPVGKGSTWEFTFDKAGSWGYHDHLAPYITGTIEVIE